MNSGSPTQCNTTQQHQEQATNTHNRDKPHMLYAKWEELDSKVTRVSDYICDILEKAKLQ